MKNAKNKGKAAVIGDPNPEQNPGKAAKKGNYRRSRMSIVPKASHESMDPGWRWQERIKIDTAA